MGRYLSEDGISPSSTSMLSYTILRLMRPHDEWGLYTVIYMPYRHLVCMNEIVDVTGTLSTSHITSSTLVCKLEDIPPSGQGPTPKEFFDKDVWIAELKRLARHDRTPSFLQVGH